MKNMKKIIKLVMCFAVMLGLTTALSTNASAQGGTTNIESFETSLNYTRVDVSTGANFHTKPSWDNATEDQLIEKNPHFINTNKFLTTDEEKNAEFNKYGGVLLLSNLRNAYDWGIATGKDRDVWSLSPQTNISSVNVKAKTKDGNIINKQVPFIGQDWKMYLEVKDTNGVTATFTPSNANGTISIKADGGENDNTYLRLVDGQVTQQMNKGIIDSSKNPASEFAGGTYQSPSYGQNQWRAEYAKNLNQYTTYFVRTVDLGGSVGSVDLLMKATNVVDVNCSGCLTYAMSKPTIVNQQAIKINKTSKNFNKNVDSKNVSFEISGDYQQTINLTLNDNGNASESIQIPMTTNKDSFEINVKEVNGNGFNVTPKDGYTVKFKSKNAVTGINEVKIWSYSVDGGRNWSEYEAVPDLNFTNAKPKVSYTTDGHGDLSKTEELVAVNGSPTGVTNIPKAGYIFKNYVANKNVTLKDGTVINAGEAITEEQIPQIVITDDVTIKAVHEKKVDIATNGRFEVNTPASKTYDGEEHKWVPTIKDTVTGKDLVEGVDYEVMYDTTDFTNVGEINATIKGKGYYEGEFNTSYNINKRKVIITANSNEKVYDGNALTANGYDAAGEDGFAKDEGLESVTVTGEQTYVGSSSNEVTGYKFKDNTKEGNYEIKLVPGLLTVTAGTADEPVDTDKVVRKTHDDSKVYKLGDVIEFTIEAKNIYAEDKDITIEEQAGVEITGDTEFKGVRPGQTVTTTARHTVTEEDILNGGYTNTVKAKFDGENTDFKNKDEVTIENLKSNLVVDKKVVSTPKNGKTYVLGEEIKYEITVTNDGNVTLHNVKVKDELTGDEWTVKELAPGQTSDVFKTTYKVTEKDLLNGKVVNKATASSDDIKENVKPEVEPGKQDSKVEEVNSSIVVDKKAKEGIYKVGEKVTYEITVKNNGNVTVSGIKVVDKLTGDSWTIDDLKPGEERVFTTKYTLTKADEERGYVKNVVTVEGLDPNGKSVEVNGEATIKVEKTKEAVKITNTPTVNKVKTGDDSNTTLCVELGLMSVVGCAIVFLQNKKSKLLKK